MDGMDVDSSGPVRTGDPVYTVIRSDSITDWRGIVYTESPMAMVPTSRSLTIECKTCGVTHHEMVPVDTLYTECQWWNEHIADDGGGHTYSLRFHETF